MKVIRILFFLLCILAALFTNPFLTRFESRTHFIQERLFDVPGATDTALAEAVRPHASSLENILTYLSVPLILILLLTGTAVLLGPSIVSSLFRRRFLSPPDSVSDRTFLAVVFGICLVLGGAMNLWVFQDYMITPDEKHLTSQARVFAQGRLVADAPEEPAFFEEPFLVSRDGKTFSVFQPGGSLLFAPSVLLGLQRFMPAFLGALSLLLVFAVGKRVAGRGVARGAVLIMLCSPFFLFHISTYYCHIAGLFWLSLFVWLFLRAREEKRDVLYLLAGTVMGAAFLSRYFDLFFGVPFGMLLLGDLFRREQGAWKRIVLFCFPIVGAGFLALLYQWACTGSPFLAPFEIGLESNRYLYIVSEFKDPHGIYGFTEDHPFSTALMKMIVNVLSLNLWVFPFALLFLVPVLFRPRQGEGLLLAGSALLILSYMPYIGTGGWSYGPRYYFPIYGCLAVLLADGIRHTFLFIQRRWGEGRRYRALCYGLLFCLVFNLCFSLSASAYIIRYVHGMTDMERVLEENDVREGIVFVTMKEGFFMAGNLEDQRDLVRKDGPFYLVNNGMDYERPVLFVHSLGREEDRAFRERFPDRAFYRFEADPYAAIFGIGGGRLTRLEKPAEQ